MLYDLRNLVGTHMQLHVLLLVPSLRHERILAHMSQDVTANDQLRYKFFQTCEYTYNDSILFRDKIFSIFLPCIPDLANSP